LSLHRLANKMKDLISNYKNIIIQIASPTSVGTGFYLSDYQMIVTNNHVIAGNKTVVIEGKGFEKSLAEIVFTDEKYDLAFLLPQDNIEAMPVPLSNATPSEGDSVIAFGHPFGLKFTATQGIISNTRHSYNDLTYFQHDAAINPGNSGGPLVNVQGEIIGINTFIYRDGQNLGFCLPAYYLHDTLLEFVKNDKNISTRCNTCQNIVFTNTVEKGYCPHCGVKIKLPNEVSPYEPIGYHRTIEDLLTKLGYNILLARTGIGAWEIKRGSATINIIYHEQQGLIVVQSILCQLPKTNIKPIYEYILRENYTMQGMSLGIDDNDILLTMLTFDRYFHKEIALQLFDKLFDNADKHDTILIEKYGAHPKDK
jgi:serine protease Do